MHLGLIMDGNGRWATMRSLPRSKGHEEGARALQKVTGACLKHGISYLTVYAFSTENWRRPEAEVSFLMNALASKLPENIAFFKKNNIRIRHRGDLSALPLAARMAIINAIKQTETNTGLTLILAINYGGQDEIARAVNRFLSANPSKTVTPEDIRANLDNPDIPDADMIVRSAGEMRLSNFMLWDSAYSELYFIDKLWPDWSENEIEQIITEYNRRTRKFGGLVK